MTSQVAAASEGVARRDAGVVAARQGHASSPCLPGASSSAPAYAAAASLALEGASAAVRPDARVGAAAVGARRHAAVVADVEALACDHGAAPGARGVAVA